MWKLWLLIVLLSMAAPVGAQGDDWLTFTSADDKLSYQYPAEWAVVETNEGQFAMSNSSAALSAGPGPGEFVAWVLTPPSIDNALLMFGLDSSYGANVVGNMMATVFGRDASPLSGPDVVTVGDGLTAYVYNSGDLYDEDLTLIVVDTDVVIGLFVVGHDYATDDLLQVAGTLSYVGQAVPQAAVVWHSGAAHDGLPAASGVAIGPDDTIYVALGDDIAIHDPESGALQERIPFAGAVDVAVDGAGLLWAVNAGGTVMQWDGEVSAIFETGLAPRQLLVGADDLLYLVDGTEIVVFSMDGEEQRRFSGLPQGRAVPHVPPLLVTFDADGTLVVMDGVGDIWIMSASGEFRGEVGTPVRALNTTAMNLEGTANLLLAGSAGEVYRIGLTGTQARFGEKASPEGELEAGTFYLVRDLAPLANGDLIVVDANETHWQVVRLAYE